jgi:thymidylate synthase (FAD)
VPESNRTYNNGAEAFLGQEIPLLDHGYIKLVDYMGTDKTVVNAARVSYGNKLTVGQSVFDQEKDGRLINFLMREGHTSPFEQCIMTFEVKTPIFVAREWVRHRTARLNEISGRYTKLPSEFYTPSLERIQRQSERNKQSSEGELPDTTRNGFIFDHNAAVGDLYNTYEERLEAGIAREVARIDLPLCIYTKFVWQMDLHNLLHFLKLRLAEGAQWEIRQYAEAIATVVCLSFPSVWSAFEEHVLHSVQFSRTEFQAMKNMLAGTTDDLGIVLNVASKFGIQFAGGPDGHKTNHQGTATGTEENRQDNQLPTNIIGNGPKARTGINSTDIFSEARETKVN